MLNRLVARLEAIDPLDVGLRMFFALFLLSTWVAGDVGWLKLPLRCLALVALVFPPLHRDRRLWAGFAGLLLVKSGLAWFVQDNHLFLLGWFALAVALGLRAADPARAIGESARWVLGLSFLFAAAWKAALSREFLGGGYFACTFLTDPRFHGAARVFAGIPDETLAASYLAARELATPACESVVLAGLTPRVVMVARLAAWWTFVIESALALAFLAPASWPRLRRARHALLCLFGLTTYLVIDIETFGWSLMAIGAAQVEPERPRWSAACFATGLVILAWDYLAPLEALARATCP